MDHTQSWWRRVLSPEDAFNGVGDGSFYAASQKSGSSGHEHLVCILVVPRQLLHSPCLAPAFLLDKVRARGEKIVVRAIMC